MMQVAPYCDIISYDTYIMQNFNVRHKKIVSHFKNMGIAVDDAAIAEYSSTEKEKLERLAERMSYLYDKIKNDPTTPLNKLQFIKEEFRALEWVFYQFNIIADGVEKVKL